MATQKFIEPVRTMPRLDPLEQACRERAPLMLAVLEAIALDPNASNMDKRLAARDVLEFGYGKPAMKIVQDVSVNHGTSSQVIEHVIEAEEAAKMAKAVTQWAARQIPFDQWPKEVQRASGLIFASP